MHYRKDIDGLRGIAVLAVILFHAGLPFMSGGFVGVDVFFVISGYLITRLIVDEYRESGSFSFRNFYERRARRILPALAVVIGFTLIAGQLLMSPTDRVDLAKSVAATVLFASNFFFFYQADYFSTNSALMPLLHTWSLGVEEQFYLLFPPLLILILRISRRSAAAVLLGVLLLASLLISVWATSHAPTFNFFLPFSRAWELMFGSLIAFASVGMSQRRAMSQAASIAGLLMICAAVVLYTEALPFPGLLAVPPVLGAALLIWSGPDTIAARFLSLKPLLVTGRLSYSLYLWHWPLLAFARYAKTGDLSSSDLGALDIVLLILATFVLSLLSYRYVEQPWRNRARPITTPRAVGAATYGLAIVAFSSALVGMGGSIITEPIRPLSSTLTIEREAFQRNTCLMRKGEIPDSQACILGAERPGPPTAAFWGDSYAAHLAPMIEAYGKKTDTRWKQYSKAGCGPINASSFEPANDAMLTDCAQFNAAVMSDIEKQPEIRTVLLSAGWAAYALGKKLARDPTQPATAEGSINLLFATIKRLEKLLVSRGGKLLIIDYTPIPGTDVLICLRKSKTVKTAEERCSSFPSQGPWHYRKVVLDKLFAPLAAQGVKFTLVDVLNSFCDQTKCSAIDRGVPLYMDDIHLTRAGSLRLLAKLEKSHGYSKDRGALHSDQIMR